MCIRDSIKTICPLHGPVLTGDLGKYLNYYDLWSSYKAEEPEKVLVASASIHGPTRACLLYTSSPGFRPPVPAL